jgi:hypothetical protein
MNETDFIRQQLSAERAHLREILQGVQRGSAVPGNARPVQQYIDWAGRRFMHQLAAHQAALATLAGGAAAPGLGALGTALGKARANVTGRERAQRLLVLLDAWTESLDTLAGTTLRINHWRQAAGLSADTILEERQLYAAARSALGQA